jgi:alkanesulfonate monooxygenase SsuD/methylene tetrahydromethanopterin reductase-like flavin-dependent oxidoreductase (luciferase family)
VIEIGAMYMGGQFSPKVFGREIEKSGFDSLWAGDHILHYVDGIATLGIFAGATDRIPLGTSVLVAPFRAPAVLAKGVLTAAWAAERQLTIGIGPGGDVAREFEVVGNDMKFRGAWTNETIEVAQLLWNAEPGTPVSYEGRFAKFHDAVMDQGGNHTYRGPRPKIWVGGRSEAALQRAVKYSSGYLPYLIDPKQLKDRVARLREICDEQKRDFAELTIAVTTFMVPAETIDAACDLMSDIRSFQNVDRERLKRYYALGSVQQCMDKLEEYIEAGATTVVLGCSPGHKGRAQLERYLEHASEIVPRVRKIAA